MRGIDSRASFFKVNNGGERRRREPFIVPSKI
jgi:hypothetical protein